MIKNLIVASLLAFGVGADTLSVAFVPMDGSGTNFQFTFVDDDLNVHCSYQYGENYYLPHVVEHFNDYHPVSAWETDTENVLDFDRVSASQGENAGYNVYFVDDHDTDVLSIYCDLDEGYLFFGGIGQLDDIYIHFGDSASYFYFKDLVNQDYVQQNNPNDGQILTDIVSLLTGGIVGLGAGIGAGVSDLASNIFISNGALSVMGNMIVIFSAVALAIALCKWVMMFLTSLGAKK